MHVQNDTETVNLGKKIAAELKGGDVVLLYGELGAGKTTFTRGIAIGLGIKKNIVSPTFALMSLYDIKRLKDCKIKRLVHIDTYRLENEKQLIEIGAEDYIGDPETVCVIEWPEKLCEFVKDRKIIKIKIKAEKNNVRKIEINRDNRLLN